MLNSLFKQWGYTFFEPGSLLREKYEALKRLMGFDVLCHEHMAEIQSLTKNSPQEDLCATRKRISLFSKDVAGMIESLDEMTPGKYSSLRSYHKKFDFYARYLLAPPKIESSPPFVVPLEELQRDSLKFGTKAKHLALINNDLDIAIPKGFAISTNGFHAFIEHNNLREEIDTQLADLKLNSHDNIEKISNSLQTLLLNSEIPATLEHEIDTALARWEDTLPKPCEFAVRSSALHEDGHISFAGQYLTVLHVSRKDISTAYKSVLASKYSQEALFYRILNGLSDEETAMSVVVQEMLTPVTSGVIYTTESTAPPHQKNSLYLYAIKGLGENLVGGKATPQVWEVNRNDPHSFGTGKGKESLVTDTQGRYLAKVAMRIEKYFDTFQDIEWAINSDGAIYILQARKLHIVSHKKSETKSQQILPVIFQDDCERASPGIATGTVYHIESGYNFANLPENSILVTRDAPPHLVKVLNRVSAIIAERGSSASHFATVARELEIPFLAGVSDAFSLLQPGTPITVDAQSGTIYQGKLEATVSKKSHTPRNSRYFRTVKEALQFITPLELIDPEADNFSPEGCRSMHDIIRFCHEKALQAMFSAKRPGSGRGSLKLKADIPLDVYLFDVEESIASIDTNSEIVRLEKVSSVPFQALWKGLSHPGVQWKQKPFDWEAYDKIILAGGVPPKRESFAFASFAVIGSDYLHFNIRFGYHFTIVDCMCGEDRAKNHCMLRFAGGGSDFDHRVLRLEYLSQSLQKLDFVVETKGDLLEAKLPGIDLNLMVAKLDMLGRLLGSAKIMDMVLKNEEMVKEYVEDFFNGRYSFSEEG